MMNDTNVPTIAPTRFQVIALKSYFWIERLSNRILWCLEHRSKSSRVVVGCLLALLVLATYRHPVHAQPAAGTHLLQDEIQTAYSISTTFDLLGNAIAFAQYLFATLAALTVIINVLAHYIRNQTIRGLGQVVLSSILRLGIPFVIIGLAPTIVPSIAFIGLQIAGSVANRPEINNGGYTDAPPPASVQDTLSDLYNNTFGATFNNGQVAVSPSNIAQFGEDIGFTLIDKAACAIQTGAAANPTSNCANANSADPSNTPQTYNSNSQVMQTIIVLCIGIIGTFVFIAIELVIAYLQIYLVLPIAAFSLGFLGAPATAQYGNGYWTVVVTALLKFVTVVFTIGFAITLANDWAITIANTNYNTLTKAGATDVGALETTIGFSMAAFSLLYIVRVLPSLFGGLLSGSSGSAEGNQAEYQSQGTGARAFGGGGSGGLRMSTGGKAPYQGGLGMVPGVPSPGGRVGGTGGRAG